MGLVLSPLILQRFGWRALFYVFGVVGLPLYLIWQAVVPGSPPQRQRSATEQAGLGPGMAPGAANVLPTDTSRAPSQCRTSLRLGLEGAQIDCLA